MRGLRDLFLVPLEQDARLWHVRTHVLMLYPPVPHFDSAHPCVPFACDRYTYPGSHRLATTAAETRIRLLIEIPSFDNVACVMRVGSP
jgi:hypothetical protein